LTVLVVPDSYAAVGRAAVAPSCEGVGARLEASEEDAGSGLVVPEAVVGEEARREEAEDLVELLLRVSLSVVEVLAAVDVRELDNVRVDDANDRELVLPLPCATTVPRPKTRESQHAVCTVRPAIALNDAQEREPGKRNGKGR